NGESLAITYSSTGDAVTAHAGTYAITGALADCTGIVSNYSVTLTNGTLTVTPAHLTVTANPASRFYGDADATFSATISGFQNGETLATSGVTGIASLSSDDTATSPVGSYTITPTQGSLAATNYDFTVFNTGLLTVNPARLTVTPADA